MASNVQTVAVRNGVGRLARKSRPARTANEAEAADDACAAAQALFAVLDPDDLQTFSAHNVAAVQVGLDLGDLDRALFEEIEGRDVVLVPPTTLTLDESYPLSQRMREAALTLQPRCKSLRIARSDFRTLDEAEQSAIPLREWMAERRVRSGRWAPTFLDDASPRLNGEYLIKGVLPSKGIGVLFGESGSGKTFFCADMARHISDGVPWRGNPTMRRGVIWIAAEAGGGMLKRLAAYRLDKQPGAPPTPFVMFDVAPDLLTGGKDLDELIAAIKGVECEMDCPVGLTVVDTFAQAMPGGNDAQMEHVGLMLKSGRAIEQATSGLVLFTHHTPHADKLRIRGHSSLHAAADVVLGIQAPKGQGKFPVRSATLHKLKDGESGARWLFSLEQVSVGHDDDGDEVTTCRVMPLDRTRSSGSQIEEGAGQLEENCKLILHILNALASQMAPGSWIDRAALRNELQKREFLAGKSSGARKGALFRALEHLVEGGRVRTTRAKILLIGAP